MRDCILFDPFWSGLHAWGLQYLARTLWGGRRPQSPWGGDKEFKEVGIRYLISLMFSPLGRRQGRSLLGGSADNFSCKYSQRFLQKTLLALLGILAMQMAHHGAGRLGHGALSLVMIWAEHSALVCHLGRMMSSAKATLVLQPT